MQRLQRPHGNGPAAHRPRVLRRSALRGHLVAVLRKVIEILRRGARRVADLEAVQPMPDVRGVADLAGLAVVEDVEPRLRLLAHGRFHAHRMVSSNFAGS